MMQLGLKLIRRIAPGHDSYSLFNENANSRLLSAPVPVPSRTRLELEVVDRRYGPLLIFALPDTTRLG